MGNFPQWIIQFAWVFFTLSIAIFILIGLLGWLIRKRLLYHLSQLQELTSHLDAISKRTDALGHELAELDGVCEVCLLDDIEKCPHKTTEEGFDALKREALALKEKYNNIRDSYELFRRILSSPFGILLSFIGNTEMTKASSHNGGR